MMKLGIGGIVTVMIVAVAANGLTIWAVIHFVRKFW